MGIRPKPVTAAQNLAATRRISDSEQYGTVAGRRM
jgi:hypothetical protein